MDYKYYEISEWEVDPDYDPDPYPDLGRCSCGRFQLPGDGNDGSIASLRQRIADAITAYYDSDCTLGILIKQLIPDLLIEAEISHTVIANELESSLDDPQIWDAEIHGEYMDESTKRMKRGGILYLCETLRQTGPELDDLLRQFVHSTGKRELDDKAHDAAHAYSKAQDKKRIARMKKKEKKEAKKAAAAAASTVDAVVEGSKDGDGINGEESIEARGKSPVEAKGGRFDITETYPSTGPTQEEKTTTAETSEAAGAGCQTGRPTPPSPIGTPDSGLHTTLAAAKATFKAIKIKNKPVVKVISSPQKEDAAALNNPPLSPVSRDHTPESAAGV